MKISVYNSFEDLKSIWIDFQKNAYCYAFQTYEWLSTWYQIVGNKSGFKPCLVLVEEVENKQLMILPLGIKSIGGIKILSWLGDKVTDYHSPLIRENITEEFFEQNLFLIWSEVKKKLPPFDVIHFDKQPEFIDGFKNPFLQLGCNQLNYHAYSFYIEGSWEKYYTKRVKKRIRSDSRRQLKRLEEKGTVKFKIVSDTETIKEITDVMINHKVRRFLETGVSNMFSNPIYSQFYHKAAEKFVTEGLIHISALYVDDKIIATHWGTVYKNRFCYLMPTYEGGEWEKYSAGRLLLIYLMKWCAENRIELFDFTIGDEVYKKDWCDKEMKIFEYRESISFKGIFYVFILWLKKIKFKYD